MSAATAPTELRLIASPCHDGLDGVDRGRGPKRLLDALGGSSTAYALQRPLAIELVDAPDPAAPEAARVFELARRFAERVRAAIDSGTFPLVLAGDCNSCLGTVAGCRSDGLGVIWFDAHGDFDTPDDSRSGSLDGMGLALLTGRAWRALRLTIPDLVPIDDERIVLAAVRDLDRDQRERLRGSGIRTLEGNRLSAADLRPALDDLGERADRVYLHLDLDALDPSEGAANQYAAPGGPSAEQLLDAISEIFARFQVAAAAITAYNPDCDADGRMACTAVRILVRICELALHEAADG